MLAARFPCALSATLCCFFFIFLVQNENNKFVFVFFSVEMIRTPLINARFQSFTWL